MGSSVTKHSTCSVTAPHYAAKRHGVTGHSICSLLPVPLGRSPVEKKSDVTKRSICSPLAIPEPRRDLALQATPPVPHGQPPTTDRLGLTECSGCSLLQPNCNSTATLLQPNLVSGLFWGAGGVSKPPSWYRKGDLISEGDGTRTRNLRIDNPML